MQQEIKRRRGRPSLSETDGRSERFIVYLPEDLAALVADYQAKHQLDKSEAIRQLLREALDEQTKP